MTTDSRRGRHCDGLLNSVEQWVVILERRTVFKLNNRCCKVNGFLYWAGREKSTMLFFPRGNGLAVFCLLCVFIYLRTKSTGSAACGLIQSMTLSMQHNTVSWPWHLAHIQVHCFCIFPLTLMFVSTQSTTRDRCVAKETCGR